jgi:TrmH family RNA methyltransferase
VQGTATHARANELVRELRLARASDELVVLEGFHPLKHALRFGARVHTVVTSELSALLALTEDHAPELRERVLGLAVELPRKEFKRLGPYEPHTGVISVAGRIHHDPLAVLASDLATPVVLLDEPRHRGNLGAVVRVAAAACAAGVISTGAQDPWHPVALRGSAGLHFALPVAWLPELAALGDGRAPARPLIAFDPSGEPLHPAALPARCVLAFGSERAGLGEQLRARAQRRLALPMRDGVSSLNLATAVAAVLYSMRFATSAQGPHTAP